MKGVKIKGFLQLTVVAVIGIFLLGCPIDEEGIFNGDVVIVNITGFDIEFISIHKATTTTGVNLLLNGDVLAIDASITYLDYDCATTYVNSVKALVGDENTTNSVAFVPPCDDIKTITWGPDLVEM